MKYVRQEKLSRNQSSLKISLFSSAEVPGSCQCSHPDGRLGPMVTGLSSGIADTVEEGLFALLLRSVAADVITSSVVVPPEAMMTRPPV